MRILNWIVVFSLLLIATAVGGAVARLVFLFSQLRALIVIILLSVILVTVSAAAAKSARWVANPYW